MFCRVWLAAGGSAKTDPAGVWWASMSFSERINYSSFVENQTQSLKYRKIELVFIGQMLEVDKITEELDKCLLNENELDQWKNDKFKKHDSWPIQSLV